MPDADQLSRVRNAARNVADDFLRFERDLDRLVHWIGEAGGASPSVQRAVNEGCDTDARRRALGIIVARIGERQEEGT